jgi:hypothetical protein
MPGLASFRIGKAVSERYGDVLAFIETRKAMSTLAARALKPSPLPLRPVKDRSPSTDAVEPMRKRKKAARSENGAYGQRSLF